MIIKSNRNEPREFDLQSHTVFGVCLAIGLAISGLANWNMATSTMVTGGFLAVTIFIGWAVADHFKARRVEREAEEEAAL